MAESNEPGMSANAPTWEKSAAVQSTGTVFPDQGPSGIEGGFCQPESPVIKFAGLDQSKIESSGAASAPETPRLTSEGPTARMMSVFGAVPLVTNPAIKAVESFPARPRADRLIRRPGSPALVTDRAASLLLALPTPFVATHPYNPVSEDKAPLAMNSVGVV